MTTKEAVREVAKRLDGAAVQVVPPLVDRVGALEAGVSEILGLLRNSAAPKTTPAGKGAKVVARILDIPMLYKQVSKGGFLTYRCQDNTVPMGSMYFEPDDDRVTEGGKPRNTITMTVR